MKLALLIAIAIIIIAIVLAAIIIFSKLSRNKATRQSPGAASTPAPTAPASPSASQPAAPAPQAARAPAAGGIVWPWILLGVGIAVLAFWWATAPDARHPEMVVVVRNGQILRTKADNRVMYETKKPVYLEAGKHKFNERVNVFPDKESETYLAMNSYELILEKDRDVHIISTTEKLTITHQK